MGSLHSIMPKHKKGKHLLLEELVIIQTRIKDGFSLRVIAHELDFSPSTISYEVKRGTVSLYHEKKKLGRSIEERPKEIDDRKEFGHWECDLVLGHKTKDDQVLLTLSERMSREFLNLRIPDKTAASVMAAFQALRKQYSEHWNSLRQLQLMMAQNLRICLILKKPLRP